MSALGLNDQQLQKMKTQPGFVAALDQSGGSTPKALAAYGIKQQAWPNEALKIIKPGMATKSVIERHRPF